MRIGINATSLNDRPSGARQRFLGLYGALFRSHPENEYLIYEPRDCRVSAWFSALPNVRGIATPLASTDRWQRLLRGFTYWPGRFAEDRLDLFEALHLPLTAAPACPTVLTIHDIRGGSDRAPWLPRMLYRRMLKRALARAHVVTVSNTMRDEILALVPDARITTIYNGIEARPTVADRPEDPAPFLLAVGHFESRKNYPALLTAMRLLQADRPDLMLTIVGKDGGSLLETEALVKALALESTVRLLTDVGDDALTALYRDAAMLVFPSTYEGFGIPILEAMAAGCPLAISNLPVFHELSEGQADYFDPHDPAAMSATISALLASSPRREAQRHYGRRRIAAFAFESLAQQLDALHRRLTIRARDAAAVPGLRADLHAARNSPR